MLEMWGGQKVFATGPDTYFRKDCGNQLLKSLEVFLFIVGRTVSRFDLIAR